VGYNSVANSTLYAVGLYVPQQIPSYLHSFSRCCLPNLRNHSARKFKLSS